MPAPSSRMKPSEPVLSPMKALPPVTSAPASASNRPTPLAPTIRSLVGGMLNVELLMTIPPSSSLDSPITTDPLVIVSVEDSRTSKSAELAPVAPPTVRAAPPTKS